MVGKVRSILIVTSDNSVYFSWILFKNSNCGNFLLVDFSVDLEKCFTLFYIKVISLLKSFIYFYSLWMDLLTKHDIATSLTGLWKIVHSFEFPLWLTGKESACQCRRHRFDSWFRNISWRRKWQPTPVLLIGKSNGQKSLVGYRPWSAKESDIT